MEVHPTCLTFGGDKVNYPDDVVGTPTADLLLVKTHLNSVISTGNARYMTLDIENFHLNTPMPRYEYIWLQLEDIPDKVINENILRKIITSDGYIYVKVAGLLAQELLEK